MVIVVTAGMVSTTWVQFLKGSLLVLFSLILSAMVLQRGLHVADGGVDGHKFQSIGPISLETLRTAEQIDGRNVLPDGNGWAREKFVRLQDQNTSGYTVYSVLIDGESANLRQAQSVTKLADGKKLVDGLPMGKGEGQRMMHPTGFVSKLPGGETETGPLGPLQYFNVIHDSEVILWGNQPIEHEDGSITTVYFQKPTSGTQVLRPGEAPLFAGIRSGKAKDRIEFISLMLALFCGTASLPHILIRYYTVKDASAARKSTIVGSPALDSFMC